MLRRLEYLVLIEKDDDGVLVASCPAFRGCNTQAKTMPELLKRIKEVIELCVKVSKKAAPKPLKFVGLQEVQIAV